MASEKTLAMRAERVRSKGTFYPSVLLVTDLTGRKWYVLRERFTEPFQAGVFKDTMILLGRTVKNSSPITGRWY